MGNIKQKGVVQRGFTMEREIREDIKMNIEGNGLVCDCGEKIYEPGTGAIERQPNYNKYFEYLECPRCKKVYYL
jgi:uncharacterized protein with PIN domain